MRTKDHMNAKRDAREELLESLLYSQAVQRYPVPKRFRSLIRQIQLDAPNEEAYIKRIQALMLEEPELERIYSQRRALLQRASAHLAQGDVYDPETDTWHTADADTPPG